MAKLSILSKFGNVYWVFYPEKSVMNMLDPCVFHGVLFKYGYTVKFSWYNGLY